MLVDITFNDKSLQTQVGEPHFFFSEVPKILNGVKEIS